MNTPNTQAPAAYWYCLSNFGAATLCIDEDDATETAAEADRDYPRHGPHQAVMLAPVGIATDEQLAKIYRKHELATTELVLSDFRSIANDLAALASQTAQAGDGVVEDEAPVVDIAKAHDYDRIAHLARLRRYALEEIAGSKSLTASPAQEARHYQRIAQKCLDEAGAQAAHIAPPQVQPAPVVVDERETGILPHSKVQAIIGNWRDNAYGPESLVRMTEDAVRAALQFSRSDRPQNCGTGYCSCIECPYGEQPAAVPASQDTQRLDALRENSWDVRCFEMPTGAGDADIGWRVIEHHMAKSHERVIGEVFNDDPRAAIDAALAANKEQRP